MQNFDIKDLQVLYEDNHIIVVVKPAGIPSQSDATNDLDMLSIVKEYVRVKENKPGDAYIGLVHRLDRPTGGVMVFAKTTKAASRLSEELKDGRMSKKYLAVTCSEPKEKFGKLEHYLKKNAAQNIVKVVPMLTEGAKRAELNYSVIDTVQGFSLVKVQLYTGRSHQIRVQMSTIGCPLFADIKYGADPRTARHNLGLWATELRLEHPTTHQVMTFIAYPPTDEVPWKPFDIARYLNVGIAVSPYEQYVAKASLDIDEK